MFQEERPLLKPLPLQGFQYFTVSSYAVNDDSCVRVYYSSYAARPAAIGSRVLVRMFDHHLEIRDLLNKSLLRTHARSTKPGSVALPDNEQLSNPSRETRRILAQAKAIGISTEQLCQSLFDSEGRVGQPRCRASSPHQALPAPTDRPCVRDGITRRCTQLQTN